LINPNKQWQRIRDNILDISFNRGVEAMVNKAIIKALVASTFVVASTCGGAMAENLIKTGQWSYFADTVMGGISDGSAEFKSNGSDKTIRLTGEVSTANNGGFIQVRSSIPEGLAKGKTGIKLKVKGNGEQYYLHIRNSSTRLPWHYYQQGFETTSTWEEVKLPFASFMKSSSFLRASIKQSTIKTIGIVAYGKDHTADISVMSLEFY
jgi:hypothetical protein